MPRVPRACISAGAHAGRNLVQSVRSIRQRPQASSLKTPDELNTMVSVHSHSWDAMGTVLDGAEHDNGMDGLTKVRM